MIAANVRYKLSWTGKIPENVISTSNHVLFVYYIIMLITKSLTIFRRHSKSCPKATQTAFFEHFPNMSADNRRLLKTSEEEDPNTFRSYINKFNLYLKVKRGFMISSILSKWNYGYFTRLSMAFLRTGNPCKHRSFDNENDLSPGKKNPADFLNHSKTDLMLFVKSQPFFWIQC